MKLTRNRLTCDQVFVGAKIKKITTKAWSQVRNRPNLADSMCRNPLIYIHEKPVATGETNSESARGKNGRKTLPLLQLRHNDLAWNMISDWETGKIAEYTAQRTSLSAFKAHANGPNIVGQQHPTLLGLTMLWLVASDCMEPQQCWHLLGIV